MTIHTTSPQRHTRRISHRAYLVAAAAAAMLAVGFGVGIALQQNGGHSSRAAQPAGAAAVNGGGLSGTGSTIDRSSLPIAPAGQLHLVYLVDSAQDADAVQADLPRYDPASAGTESQRTFQVAGTPGELSQAEFLIAQLRQGFGEQNVRIVDLRGSVGASAAPAPEARDGRTEAIDATRASVTRPATAPQPAFIYLVDSQEQAAAAQAALDNAAATVETGGASVIDRSIVVADPAVEDGIRRVLADENTLRVSLGLPEVQIVDLRRESGGAPTDPAAQP